MAAQLAAMSGVVFKLQDAQTTGNGTVLAIPSSFRNHTFIINGSTGISAGAVQLENSNDPNYTGTWDPLTGPITVTANALQTVTITGLLNFIRARITTAIVGGTVSVEYEGAKSY